MRKAIDMKERGTNASALPFEIDSPEKASWLVRKIVECRLYGTRAKAFAEREQCRAAREEQALWQRFGGQLEAWVQHMIAASGGRRKSVSFPAGTVGYRRVGPKLIVEDKEAVLRWAKEHVPDAVVVTERLLKAKLNEVMETTGLIPDEGVHFEPATERLFVR